MTLRIRFLVALFFVPGLSHAGGWTLPRGAWYVEESISHFQNDEDFNRRGEKQKKDFSGVYSETVAKTYIEYGVIERWNIVTSLPYRRAHFVDDYNNIQTAGFRDFSMGLKWRWKLKPTVVSFAVTGAVPTGYDPKDDLPLGDARGNIEGRMFVSRQARFLGKPIFLDFEVAKDRYGVPFYVEAVHLPLPWLFAKFYAVGSHNFPRQPDGEDFIKFNAGLGLTSKGSNAIMRSERYKSISLSLLYGELFQGRNSGHGRDVTLSMALVF